MANVTTSEVFEPCWAIPPGATIAAILSARSLSRESFANKLGESLEMVHRLLLGLEAIDDDLAERLSNCLGSSQAFWLARESQFRQDASRLRQSQALAEREAWVRQFPAREMASLGWIGNFRSTAQATEECLKLFGVSDVAAWKVRYAQANAVAAFRMSWSAATRPGAVTAWLRWAELIAERTPCEAWNPVAFEERLQNVRRLTWRKDPAAFLPTLRQLCAEVGVVVVVARTPSGCPASGATCFLSPKKAMMVLSFRYRSDDQFWFTFFHEAAHLLLHEPNALFLEDDSEVTSEEEREANEFAETVMIPSKYVKDLQTVCLDKDSIIRLARKVGIAPGLIVGQLQYKKRIPNDRLNWLKRRYDWRQIEADRLIP